MSSNEKKVQDASKKENVHKDHRKRVKERFLNHGLDTFSEHQVLETALFFALPHVDTNEMAHHLINRAGSFVRVFDLPIEELMKVKGIKDNAATFIKFLSAFSKYYANQYTMTSAKPGMSYDEIGQMFIDSYVGEQNEVVMVCFFDEYMHLIQKKVLSVGEFSHVSVNFRKLTNEIFAINARSIALAHNHPSFSPVPSSEDFSATQALQKLLLQVDVNLIEHYVVTGDKYLGILKFDETAKKKHKKSFE